MNPEPCRAVRFVLVLLTERGPSTAHELCAYAFGVDDDGPGVAFFREALALAWADNLVSKRKDGVFVAVAPPLASASS